MTDTEPTAALPMWANRITDYEPDVDPTQLLAHPLNARRHPRDQREALNATLGQVGWVDVVKVNRLTGHVVDGHARVEEAITRGENVQVLWLDLTEDEERYVLATLDPIAGMAVYDAEVLPLLREGIDFGDDLDGLLDGLQEGAYSLPPLDDDGNGGVPPLDPNDPDEQKRTEENVGALARRFVAPPFSILDTRQGYWQSRKREWLALGIHSELGRGDVMPSGSSSVWMGTSAEDGSKVQNPTSIKGREANAIPGGSRFPAAKRADDGKTVRGDSTGKAAAGNSRREADANSNVTGAPPLPDWADNGVENMAPGTSIFDPVLCEISYRWYTARGHRILDPFAGGSIRGIAAGLLGRNYVGVDLRSEQIVANEEQAATICAGLGIDGRPAETPDWVVGDSPNLDDLLDPEEQFDFMFTCPPYFDLEVYSDDPLDLSRADSYDEFLVAYREILAAAARRLKDDRFAVIVISEVRDKDGVYRGLVPDTIKAMEDAGCEFYNEAILINASGSLPLRVQIQFLASRKLGRTHQQVLTFVKGDPKKATEAAGPVEIDLVETESEAADVEVDQPAGETEGSPVTTSSAGPIAPAKDDSVSPTAEPEMAAWQKGYPLDELRPVTEVFGEFDKGLILGAFSGVKDNAVAEWREAGKLHLFADGHAAVIASVTSRQQGHKDFTGETRLTAPSGTMQIDRIAAAGAGVRIADILPRLVSNYDGPVVAQGWVEHPAVVEAMVEAGLVWVGSKVKASSELVGIWQRGCEVSSIAEPDLWTIRQSPSLEFDPAELAAEITAAGIEWVDHYSSYNQRHSWTAISLRSFGGDQGFVEKPAEMSKGWKAEHPDALDWPVLDTPLMDTLPLCAGIVRGLGQVERVRLMRLAPKDGELSRHADITDRDAGTADGRVMRLHFPIVTNDAVMFNSWSLLGEREEHHMAAGHAYYLDVRKPHAATNTGDTDRVHLVVDVLASEATRSLFT